MHWEDNDPLESGYNSHYIPVAQSVCSHSKSLQSCPTLDMTVAHKAPLSMGFSRQEYWGG